MLVSIKRKAVKLKLVSISGPSHGSRHPRGGALAALRRLNRRLSTAGSLGRPGPSASLHPATLAPVATLHKMMAERVDLPVDLQGEPLPDCVLAQSQGRTLSLEHICK